jgi:hypothetical protein
MRRDSDGQMFKRLGLALGAGLATALLFIVTVQGTALAMALAYLAPLPLMIAVLGWGIDIGLIALGVACALVAGAVEPITGAVFGASVALPSWALASLARLESVPRFRRSSDSAAKSRVGVGTLVTIAAGFGALISASALVALIIIYGGYQQGLEGYTNLLLPPLREAFSGSISLPDGLSIEDVARLAVKYSPAAIAVSTTLMLLFNLYAAARATHVSQLLGRPWPDLPNTLAAPQALGALAIAALVVWLTAPEPASQFGSLLVGALGVVYVLQGLATLHALSRRAPGRPFLIIALYLACAVAPRFVLPAVAVIGLVESIASLRARAAPRPLRP